MKERRMETKRRLFESGIRRSHDHSLIKKKNAVVNIEIKMIND